MFNYLKNLKLSKKMVLLIIIMVCIIFLMENVNRRNAYDKFGMLIHEKNSQIIDIYVNYIESVFDNIENITYQMIGDVELQEKLIFVQNYAEEHGYAVKLGEANELIKTYFEQGGCLDCLMVDIGRYQFKFGSLNMIQEKDIEEYTELAIGKNGTLQRIAKEGQLIFVREIRWSDKLEYSHLGYLFAWIDFDALVKNVKRVYGNQLLDFQLSIYDGDVRLYTSAFYTEEMQGEDDGWYIDGTDFVTVHTDPKSGYTLIIRSNYEGVQKQINQVVSRSLLFSFLIAVLIVFLCRGIIKYVIKDLEVLICKMDDFGKGKELKKKGEEKCLKRTDEIGMIYQHFYQMIQDYEKLTAEYYENKILLKEMEFTYLQKQIQPHFLYNTLSAISWMAYGNQDKETACMVDKLGKMMRVITDNQDQIISVARDLQIVEDYVEIQKMRYGDRLKVDIQISDSTKKLGIPKISLQPLVENSIIHGMDEMLSDCEIKIYEQQEGDAIVIIVEDNGKGFDEGVLEKINGGIDEAKTGCRIGLRNIHIRLQYSFSEKYGLSFRRLTNGMQVRVRIPAIWDAESFKMGRINNDKGIIGG